MKTFALTIAGSDPSGGAGIQSDLKTFHLCQTEGLSVITVVTAQTSKEFKLLYTLPKKVVSSQVNVIFETYPISAAKTGLLFKKDMIEIVIKQIKKRPQVKWVVDPILKATLGKELLQPKAISALKKLIQLSFVVTPNLDEASFLSQRPIHHLEDMKKTAQIIYKMGPQHVLIKGGHLLEDPIDLLYDGKNFYEYRKKRIQGTSFHGLGCRFSAALTAFLAKGESITSAVQQTEDFMTQAIPSLV